MLLFLVLLFLVLLFLVLLFLVLLFLVLLFLVLLFLVLLFLVLLLLSDPLRGVLEVPRGASIAGPLAEGALECVRGFAEVCGGLLVLFLL